MVVLEAASYNGSTFIIQVNVYLYEQVLIVISFIKTVKTTNVH